MPAPTWDVTVVPNLTATWIEPQSQAVADSHLVQIYPASDSYALVRLPQETFTIGRDPACDLPVVDESASRRHATIEFGDAGYSVIDLESTNGTFVNDTRVQRCILSSGDRLRVGRHIFKFLTDDRFEARYHEMVHAMATRDGLTSAYNKRYFEDALAREWARCQRQDRPLSLVIVDLDHFKSVNDTYGHLAGDEVLIELAKRVTTVVRRDDTFARYGGEEFVILLPDTQLDAARDFAERLRAAIIDKPFATSQRAIPVTASLGIATANSEMADATALVDTADRNLYTAKSAGRNRVVG